jgi:hypothetical protein
MSVAIFWDIAPCSSYVNRYFGGSATYYKPVSWLANFWPLKIEVICSFETSVHIRTTRLYIPEDGNTSNVLFCEIVSPHRWKSWRQQRKLNMRLFSNKMHKIQYYKWTNKMTATGKFVSSCNVSSLYLGDARLKALPGYYLARDFRGFPQSLPEYTATN